jgi:hypothetical protein
LYFHEQLLFQMFPVMYEEIRSTLQQMLYQMFLDDVQNNYHGQQYTPTQQYNNTSTGLYTNMTTQLNNNIILQQYDNTSTQQYTSTTTQQNSNITLQQYDNTQRRQHNKTTKQHYNNTIVKTQ